VLPGGIRKVASSLREPKARKYSIKRGALLEKGAVLKTLAGDYAIMKRAKVRNCTGIGFRGEDEKQGGDKKHQT